MDLVHACPDCKHPWPNYESIYLRHCNTCGNSYEQGNAIERRELDRQISEELKAFQSIVSIVDLKKVTSIKAYHPYIDRDTFCPTGKYSASVALSIDDTLLCEEKRRCVRVDQFSKVSFPSSSEKKSTKAKNDSTTSTSKSRSRYEIREKVLEEIACFVEKTMGKAHCLKAPSDQKTDHLCPYCRAFSYWCKVISFEPALIPQFDYTCELYKRLKGMEIVTPRFLHFLKPQEGKNIEAPHALAELIYELDLKWSYITLYAYHCDIQHNFNQSTITPKTITYVDRTLSQKYKWNLFDAFWIGSDEENITLSYLSEHLLSEKYLPRDERLSYNNCKSKPICDPLMDQPELFLDGRLEMTEFDYACLTRLVTKRSWYTDRPN